MLAWVMGKAIYGLNSKEAEERLAKFGPNKLPEKPPASFYKIFFSQLKNPLVYILIGATIVTVLLQDYKDAAIISLAVLLNTIFGFIQEYRANRALEALKKIIEPKANIIRDGKPISINVAEIVPGDVVILSSGDKIPADGKLIFANRLFVNESVLTGESAPVEKSKGDKGFMGTIVVAGSAQMEVSLTGSATEIGKIAQSVRELDRNTPLRRQLSAFGRQLLVVIGVLLVGIFTLGVARGNSFLEIFATSVALAVSAIPEGLIVALTVVLAIGMQRILARRGLVRSLVSAETLGGVTTICTDKTGTLTQGKMKVTKLIGDRKLLAEQVFLANDLDDPMVVAAYEWAKEELNNEKYLVSNHRRIDSIPFSSETRFFASLHHNHKSNILFVNGAPEFLLSSANLSEREKKEYLALIYKLTKEGYRLIGFAKKNMPVTKRKITQADAQSGLEWVGVLAFSDPVRAGVKEALEKTKNAGIKIIVITGDYPQTASYVMKQLGLEVSEHTTMLGEELAKISTRKLRRRLKGESRVTLFARTTPAQKLKIVESLKENGEVVAMMGDGVNDAPALGKADIGIVVGEATDVAREAADLILLDSSFETIVSAVEEGRGIFDNIRKVLLYLTSGTFSEIVAVVVCLIAGLPLPLTVAQILWVNIVADGLPAITLTIDPKREDIMNEPPRRPKEPLVVPWVAAMTAVISGIVGAITVAFFVFYYGQGGDIALARSIAFAALGVNSFIYIFSVRNMREPIWKSNFLNNKWLLGAVLAGFFLQALPFYASPLRDYFGVSPLSLNNWLTIAASALVMFALIEVSKVVLRQRR